MEIELNAIVLRTGAGRHSITDGACEYTLQSGERFNRLDALHITGEISDNVIVPSKIEKLGNPTLAEAVGMLGIKIGEWNPTVKSPVLEKCRPAIEKTAMALKLISIMGPKATMRFHGDADGISAALSVSPFVPGLRMQQNSAVYGNRDAFGDIAQLKFEAFPTLVLLDCCTNDESMEALDLAKSAGINILAIDHHPCSQALGGMGIVLNPWLYDPEEDASKFTAGYLAYEAVKLLGHDASGTVGISLAGDKSSIMPISEKDRERALVFDFVASYSSFSNRLEFYKDLMGDNALYQSILAKAKEHLENVSAAISQNMKRETLENGITLITVNLDRAAKRSEFPGRGKMTTRAYEMAGNEDVVVIGYSEKSLILRVGHMAYERGVRANGLVKALVSEYRDNSSGGGHARAAAFLFSGLPADYLLQQMKKMVSEVKQ
jgi:RecJ-like exonuclease